MKRILFTMLMATLCMTSMAQTMTLIMKDGAKRVYRTDEVERVMFSDEVVVPFSIVGEWQSDGENDMPVMLYKFASDGSYERWRFGYSTSQSKGRYEYTPGLLALYEWDEREGYERFDAFVEVISSDKMIWRVEEGVDEDSLTLYRIP